MYDESLITRIFNERDIYKGAHLELRTFFRQRFGVLIWYHDGYWDWKTSEDKDLGWGKNQHSTFEALFQWCIDNRNGYENISAE